MGFFGKKPETKSDEFTRYYTKLVNSINEISSLYNKGNSSAARKEYLKACEHYDACVEIYQQVVDEYLEAEVDYAEIDSLLLNVKETYEAFYSWAPNFDFDFDDIRNAALGRLELMRGEIQVRAGKNHLAVKTLQDALEYDTPDEESLIYRFLGDAYNNLEKHEEALDAYTESLESDWNCAEVWCGKASALLDLGRYDEALEAAETARDLSEVGSENYLTSIVSIDWAYYGLGKLDNLLANVVPHTNLDKVDGLLWYMHYLILQSAGVKSSEVSDAYNNTLKLYPDIETNEEINGVIHQFQIELQKIPFGSGKTPSQKPEPEQSKTESAHDLPNALIWYAKYLRLKNDDAPASNCLEAYNTAINYYPDLENREEAQTLRTEIFAANKPIQPQKPVESNIHYHVTGSFFAGNVGVLAKDDAVVNRANIGEDKVEGRENIFCPDCGRKLPVDAIFCMGCGKKLK
ncbi:MAG: tetratricopeptide repeat protein [Methanocorpusculum sp.]|jgi:tetratricopeptide (TPR) repeat protein|nr:tetratricopeptide repeat protein [Methanocorpusculum sp.]